MSGASALGGTAATGVGLVQGAAALPAVTASLSPAGKRIIAAMDKAKYNSQIATAAEAVTAFINPMHSGGGHWLAQAIAAARLVHDNKDNIKNIVNRLTGE